MAHSTKKTIIIDNKEVTLSNLNKIMFPGLGVTKADVIDYYIRMSKYILPYLKNRPFTMIPFPDGVEGKSFYQKQKPDDAPQWLQSIKLPSGEKFIDWCLVNDLPSLVYMANRGNLEMHTWFSRLPDLDKPDIAVFDIDPSGNTDFKDALAAARLIKIVLDEYNLLSVPKTSGKTGLHIVVPIEPTPFSKVREFLLSICHILEKTQPELFTTERTISKRGNRVYLDAVQNARGKTLPAPYSLRASGKATVSAPLTWDEIMRGKIFPDNFTIKNIEQRVNKHGDMFSIVYNTRQILPKVWYDLTLILNILLIIY